MEQKVSQLSHKTAISYTHAKNTTDTKYNIMELGKLKKKMFTG